MHFLLCYCSMYIFGICLLSYVQVPSKSTQKLLRKSSRQQASIQFNVQSTPTVPSTTVLLKNAYIAIFAKHVIFHYISLLKNPLLCQFRATRIFTCFSLFFLLLLTPLKCKIYMRGFEWDQIENFISENITVCR